MPSRAAEPKLSRRFQLLSWLYGLCVGRMDAAQNHRLCYGVELEALNTRMEARLALQE